MVADDFERPNGLAFSADETELYVADTRARHIRRFAVSESGVASGGELFADCDCVVDGIRFDEDGRLWVAADDGARCYDPDGTLLGTLRLPDAVSNLTFGGPKRNVLFLTATWAVYAIRLRVCGVRYPA